MKCIFVKEDDKQCEANAMLKAKHCFYHNPNVKKEVKLFAQVKGGMGNRIGLQESLPVIPIKNTKDVVVLLADTVDRVRSGELDIRIANAIGFLSGHLLKALQTSDLEERMEKLEELAYSK